MDMNILLPDNAVYLLLVSVVRTRELDVMQNRGALLNIDFTNQQYLPITFHKLMANHLSE